MSEADHLPDKKVKDETDLALEAFVDDIHQIYPDLDREEFRRAMEGYVEQYVPDYGEEEDGGEEEEEEERGLMQKAKDKLPGQ